MEIWYHVILPPVKFSMFVLTKSLELMEKTRFILDLSHIDSKQLDIKLGGIMEIYEKFMGDDPRKVPMKIFPGVHYSMGGLWVDFDQKTNIPGLFAAGECDYSQHGANRLGANSLLSAVYGGMVAGPKALEYVQGLEKADGYGFQHLFLKNK